MRFVSSMAVVLSLPLFVLSNIAFAEEQIQPTISVNGVGVVSASPDIAIVNVGVMREEKTAREALNANNAAMARVLNELTSIGIEARDLQTSNFNIQPKYVYPKRKANGEQPAPEIVGYFVSNNLTIRIRDLEQTGTILDKIVTLGVNSGGGIRFTNEDTETLLTQARESAVKNAIAKAQTLTSTASVGLGKILSINESSNTPRPVAIHQARSLAVQEDAGSVPIAGGENEYRVNVSITWEIEQ
ncbi:MAG: SIMPL domain-containing protein [Rhizobiaceae bacterium]|nr:SIMPL domain-containing protein [Rhizobiaceae bacterium]